MRVVDVADRRRRSPAGADRAGGPRRRSPRRVADEAEVWQALVLGLRDYVRKNGFRSVVLGLSGGIDSAVVAAHRRRRARARQRGRRVAAQRALLGSTPGTTPRTWPSGPAWTTGSSRSSRWSTRFLANMSLSGLAVENLQARVRGVILMALSNQEGHLVLTTGNKSELAVGYSTLYGDSVGGFNPLKDVPKTLVWQLAPLAQRGRGPPRRDAADPGELDHQAAERRAAPRPARHRLAARLRGARRDPGRLRRRRPGPRRPGRGRPRPGAWSTGCCGWSTSPSTSAGSPRPGTKISIKAFGRDRRLPITNRLREDG